MAMTEDLSKEFEVIVLGTGMPESIVAAACSRIGQTVLHLDKNDHYSGDWASFNLKGIEIWAQQHTDIKNIEENCIARPSVDESSLLQEGETLIELPLNNTNFSNTHFQYYLPESDDEDKEQEKEDVVSKLADKLPDQCDINDSKVSEIEDNTDIKPCDDKAGNNDTELINQQENAVTNQDSCVIEGGGQDVMEQVENDQSNTNENSGLVKDEIDNNEKLSETEQNRLETEQNKTEFEQIRTETEQGITDKESVDKVTKSEESSKKVEDTVHEISNEGPDISKTSKKKWTRKRLKGEWRKFNLDLSPKILYSVGDMVELLISSDIAKYCEFKTITQVITLMNGNLERVPCSRADVFSSKKVNMLEKRMLMKFLQFCIQYENKPEEIAEFLEKPFAEFLAHKKLTPSIKHYIQHSIAMATESMTTKQGLEKMKKFLQSLGRYGNTAFLWSLYGSGEIPQSFCRMCAVFGGVYCLRMTASSMILDQDHRCCGVVTTDGHRIKCKWLIMEGSYAPKSYIDDSSKRKKISRGIVMTETPLLTTGQQEQLSLMNLPCPDDGNRPITILELPPSSMAAPPGVYVYHLTRTCKEDVLPKDDLSYAINTLFSHERNMDENKKEDKAEENKQDNEEQNKPAVIWSLYFTQTDMSEVQASSNIPENIVLMSGPGTEIDIDTPVLQAKEVFKKILPDEEFLPKAPNPEDIIYVDDSEAQVADGDNQSEFLEKEHPDGDSNETDKPEVTNTEDNQSKTEDVEQTRNPTETDQLEGKDSMAECDKSEEKSEN